MVWKEYGVHYNILKGPKVKVFFGCSYAVTFLNLDDRFSLFRMMRGMFNCRGESTQVGADTELLCQIKLK